MRRSNYHQPLTNERCVHATLPYDEGGIFSLRRAYKDGTMCNLIVRSFVLLALASMMGCMTWDGAFATAEYRLHVRDKSGAPVADAELTVRDAHEQLAYEFPIDDFNRAISLRTDSNGTLVFHHVSGGLEFGGTCVVPFCSPSHPKFFLDLSTHDRLRVRMAFDDFANATPNGERKAVPLLLTPMRAWIAQESADRDAASATRGRAIDALNAHDDHTLLQLMSVTVASMPIVERDVVVP
jgi:hypothetical protein